MLAVTGECALSVVGTEDSGTIVMIYVVII
jgi:hypothetical protein